MLDDVEMPEVAELFKVAEILEVAAINQSMKFQDVSV